MDKDLKHFKGIVESKGHLFTRQKQSILKVLMESDIHLSAAEIQKKLQEEPASIATVYRSLKVFIEAGIIREINIDGTGYYEMKLFSGKPMHIHFMCQKCNKIFDIDSKKSDAEYLKLNMKIEKDNDLEIYDSNIVFVGICSTCKSESKNIKREEE